MRNMLVLLMLAFSLIGFDANAQGLATYSDWQVKWGTVDINSENDPIIPSIRHGVKKDLDTMITLCNSKLDDKGKHVPLDADYSKLKTFDIDFDGDGRPDIMLDLSTYFTGEQLPTCPVQICSKEGCDMPLYHNDSDTQVIEGKPAKDDPCPATAELNTDCRKECAATEKQCPALFNYSRTLRWAGRMFSWTFTSADEYMAMREASKNSFPDKRYIYREALNKNPVFKLTRDVSYCNMEEMDTNHDGVVSSSEPCTKYLQYTTDKTLCKGADGCFVDMYFPKVLVTASDDAARYIDWKLSDVPSHFFDETFAIKERASTVIDGVDVKGAAFKLAAGHALASQVPNFDVNAGAGETCKDVEYDEQVCDSNHQTVGEQTTGTNCHIEHKHKNVCTKAEENKQFMCKEYYNRSDKSVFIPAETDIEYVSFLNAAESGKLKDVSVRECERKFTPWSGPTSCAQVQVACNQVVNIRAERFCIRSTSSTGSCGECAGKDTQVIDGFRDSCEFSATCTGAPCPSSHFCVAADTKILMADGSEKAILDVHVGDMVKAFDSKDKNKTLKDAKVKAVLITAEQKTIALNDLKITSIHKVIMADGRKVAAKDIKIGDKILKSDNKVMTVEKIATDLDPITVYNLDVEDADGYIAGGLKVMDYPAPTVK